MSVWGYKHEDQNAKKLAARGLHPVMHLSVSTTQLSMAIDFWPEYLFKLLHSFIIVADSFIINSI